MGQSAGENRGEMVMVMGCAVEAGVRMLLVMILMLRVWWRCWLWGVGVVDDGGSIGDEVT